MNNCNNSNNYNNQMFRNATLLPTLLPTTLLKTRVIYLSITPGSAQLESHFIC